MSTYEISKSSLVSLKAEILRKHQELAKTKNDNDRKLKLIKKNTPLEFKNKNFHKDKETGVTEIISENEDDRDLLKKSRLILEQKSALYERLRSGNVTEEEKKQNKRLLVRFDENGVNFGASDDEPDKLEESDDNGDFLSEDEHSIDPAEKWVDYVDCLGRTRKCLQKDLEYIKSKDLELKKVVDAKKRASEINSDIVNIDSNVDNNCEAETNNDTNKSTDKLESELLSSDMRREILREQWEKEEEKLRQKSDIHYQDILFGEARTHGVGYYGFSKNENERLRQQEALKQLRAETEQKQKRAQELKMLRDAQLAARIKAAKERRRARLGLPPEEEEKEPETSESNISEEEKQKQLELEKQKGEKEKILEEARKRHVRPWDAGKEGVPKEHYEMSQEEWNEMKRSERVEEFAPPTVYKEKKKEKNNNNQLKEKIRKKKNQQWRNEKATFCRKDPKFAQTPSVEATVDNSSDPSSFNYISSDSECIDDEIQGSKRGRGAEIPPPLNSEYFAPTSSKLPRTSFEKININESIEAGLRFLRNQIEKKEKKPKDVYFS